MSGRIRRRYGCVGAAVAALACLAAAPAVARADALALSVTQSTDAGVVVQASGATTDPSGATLDIEYLDAGGSCEQGSGIPIDPNGQQPSTGPFSVSSSVPVPVELGSYVLCGWLTGNSSSTITGAQPVSFTVSPADTISLSPDPNVLAGQPFNVTAAGTVYDSAAGFSATYKPAAGGSCASTPQADAGTSTASSQTLFPGAYSTYALNDEQLDPGSYLVCGWLVDGNTGQVLAAGAATVPVGASASGLDLRLPNRVDSTAIVPIDIGATLDASIPYLASADVVADHPGTACAANPAQEPAAAYPVIHQDPIEDSTEPSGGATAAGEVRINDPGQYLVCAWLLDGWSLVDNPPTLAGPIASTITVVGPLTYSGRTSQHARLTISIASIAHSLSQVTWSDHLRCSRPAFRSNGRRWNGEKQEALSSANFGAVRVGTSIRLRLNGNPNHTFDLAARLVGKHLIGAFTEAGTPDGLIGNTAERFRCTSGKVRFKLTA